MNKNIIKQMAEILAIYAELKAMEVLNMEREAKGKAFAYGEEAFLHEADKLRAIERGIK